MKDRPFSCSIKNYMVFFACAPRTFTFVIFFSHFLCSVFTFFSHQTVFTLFLSFLYDFFFLSEWFIGFVHWLVCDVYVTICVFSGNQQHSNLPTDGCSFHVNKSLPQLLLNAHVCCFFLLQWELKERVNFKPFSEDRSCFFFRIFMHTKQNRLYNYTTSSR